MIRVLVADDHQLMREGLKRILSENDDINVVAEAENGAEVIQRLRAGTVEVVLMDMLMPGRSGIDLIRQIKSEFGKVQVLVLSSHKENVYAVRTIKAGASGYLCKDQASEALVLAIRKVAKGGIYIEAGVAELMARSLHPEKKQDAPHLLLSDREYQVFLLIAGGKGLTEIATLLNLSVKTVSTHKVRIKEKLQLSNNNGFLHYAMKHNLLGENFGEPA